MASVARVCSVEECGRKYYAKGFCNAHRQRHRDGRPLEGLFRKTNPGRGCKVANCDRPHGQNGFCQAHNKRHISGRPLNTPIQIRNPNRKCVISGCDRRYSSIGLCSPHRSTTGKYGLTPIQYMMIQEGGCQVCGSQENLIIDHDHSCCPGNSNICGNCNRGGLCSRCNVGIGMLKESKEILLSAVGYLAKFGKE